MRWAHEIDRFPGLKAVCATGTNTVASLAPGDVLLCGYSLLSGVSLDLADTFHAMILDIRHPNGFRGSGMNEDFDIQHDTPEQLLQSSWWEMLAMFSKSCNRIIVGRLDTSLSFLNSGSNRQRLSILGLQLGLLIGVSHFGHMHGCSLEKSILHWGRVAAKSSSSKESKYRKVFSLFSATIQKCCIELKDGNRRHSSDEDVWDIRLCEMPGLHRDEYQKSCREVFAVLSRGSVSPQKIAKAMLVLRQNCICSKHLIASYAKRNRLLSSSEPNVDAAKTLLVHSGKLQELAAILVCEFGMEVPLGVLKSLPIGEKKKLKAKGKNTTDTIKRVAILAVSTEIQILISALLCHLGIFHHLLVDHSEPWSIVPWVRSQETLRSFNEHEGDCYSVLVSSPRCVAGDNVGLGIERADAVLCVEDDWSGRGELIMKSLTQRNRYRRDAEGLSICRFINLAAKDSVEDSLLNFGGLTTDESEPQVEWPSVCCFVKPDGLVAAPRSTVLQSRGKHLTRSMWDNSPFSPSLSSFPARNMFLAASTDLEDLLRSGKMAAVELVGKQKTTLLSSVGIKSFPALVSELMAGEDQLSLRMTSIASLDPAEYAVTSEQDNYLTRGLTEYLQQSSLRKIFFAQTRQLCRSETQTNQSSRIQNRKGEMRLVDTALLPSTLFYRPKKSPNRRKRTNFYAAVFSLGRQQSDWLNEVSEPLVYFPPLFPLVKECSLVAQTNVELMNSQSYSSEDVVVGEEDKTTHSIVTEEEASHSDAASVLIDLYDDYGLAGLGAIPLPRDSALAASAFAAPIPNNRQSSNRGDYPSGGENVEGNAVILLTTKKRRRGPGPLQRSAPAWNGTLSNFNASNEMDISQQSGAMSRSSRSILDPYADRSSLDSPRQKLLTRLRRFGMGTSMFEAPIYRVASVQIRNNVADRLRRHEWTAGPVYETGPGLPLVVAKHQSVPANSHRGFFEFDPSLWTSVVKRIQNRSVVTGAEAFDLSTGQRAAFRRSLVAPCRVDFGPFQCGFLSATGGLSVGAPPRNRVGVTLPMGVKLSSSLNKEQISMPWSADEDRQLHAAAERFCLNWVVTAAELSGSQDIAVVSHAESPRFRASRAARSCRDRWQRLVRNSPSMLVGVRQSERFSLKPSEPPSSNELSGQSDVDQQALLLHITTATKEASEEASSFPNSIKRRTFHAFRASQARTEKPPFQIPGITPGSNHATVVPSHQSHEQHNCKPDLCPLHILDSSASGRNEAANRR